MTNHLPVQGRDDVFRDPFSKAILKADSSALEDYRKKREMFKTLMRSDERLNKLESDMSEIKASLNALVEFIKEKK